MGSEKDFKEMQVETFQLIALIETLTSKQLRAMMDGKREKAWNIQVEVDKHRIELNRISNEIAQMP